MLYSGRCRLDNQPCLRHHSDNRCPATTIKALASATFVIHPLLSLSCLFSTFEKFWNFCTVYIHFSHNDQEFQPLTMSNIYLGVIGEYPTLLHLSTDSCLQWMHCRRRWCWNRIPEPTRPSPQCPQADPPRTLNTDPPGPDTGLLPRHPRR
jgi:hypothetical protein